MSRPICFMPAALLLAVFTLQTPAALPKTTLLSSPQIDQLLASIALYPDPLLSRILPASTEPLELVIAWQWLRLHPMPTDALIANQSWNPSIQFLAHYPTVLELLAENLDWTRQVGLTYTAQRAQVNQSIQRLRAQARASGSLSSTPQQKVAVQPDNTIQIEPAEPDVIYVPIYDTADCFTHLRPPEFQKPGPTASVNPPATPSSPHTAISRSLPNPPVRPESISPRSAPDYTPGYTISSDDSPSPISAPSFTPAPSRPDPTPIAAPTPQPEPTATAVSTPEVREPERSEPPAPREQNNGRSSVNR
ncbi:MAG TPA: DUF3300 domain-containing protein [Tepidisphaeraceae bacterium]|jgi:hypothetical protein|nr:DUF3300 domain-containing protein [Tepidisphaeraceae bacterium]